MTKVKIEDYLDAIEAMLEADSTLRGGSPLIASDSSIIQREDISSVFDTQLNTLVRMPALLVTYDSESWINDGYIHTRRFRFSVFVMVSDPRGLEDRAATAYPIIEAVHSALVDNTPSGLSGVNGPIKPRAAAHFAEVLDPDGNPLNISVWKIDYESDCEWQ